MCLALGRPRRTQSLIKYRCAGSGEGKDADAAVAGWRLWGVKQGLEGLPGKGFLGDI